MNTFNVPEKIKKINDLKKRGQLNKKYMGYTPLGYLAGANPLDPANLKLADLLLIYGSRPNILCNVGNCKITPLEIAANNGNLPMAQKLSKVTHKKYHRNALLAAARSGHRDVFEEIRKHSPELAQSIPFHRDATQEALEYSHYPTAQFLAAECKRLEKIQIAEEIKNISTADIVTAYLDATHGNSTPMDRKQKQAHLIAAQERDPAEFKRVQPTVFRKFQAASVLHRNHKLARQLRIGQQG